MNTLLQEITRSGTAAKAKVALKRGDIYGKTGTTNDSMDAWFAGFHPTLTAVTWIGYDTPRKMGSNETGGGLSLPVWITFMEHALKGVPEKDIEPPEGVVNSGGEWYFDEFKGRGVQSLGLDDPLTPTDTAPAKTLPVADEKKKILDLFRN
jgi:penicillin-binding protein 1A